ncbi:ATP-binding protein [Actinomadura verrucosospora]|uniref:ATP-binding protein n=1 Tax=Actinomadura verrucosospora TaxID=46165 RepID=UPI001FEC1C16|nr:LuxR C-terminal-related transcriptional regulator [Actinomadura verrucosospora]
MALNVTLERQTGRLPAEFTSFVGRETELDQVGRLIDGHRLVTLTGPGGVGKTRLAVRTAARARDAFDGGVYFVALSGLTEPSLLAQAVCDALGLAEQGGEPAASRLADHLADRRVLLVLDTCEHLLDECAALAEALLQSAPGLRVLVTSRQPLDVLGEQTIAVAPLGRPDPGRAGAPGEECDSVKLFTERAAAAVQGWTLHHGNREAVVRLCDRLDGIPLAIELAAVQLRTFSADQVLSRLGSRLFQARGMRTSVPRHQTLRAAIDWSHALCSPGERLLWARLSVFAGDFELDAAEHVCSADDLPAEHVVELLTGLVDKSIVQRADRGGQVRYRMLDSLREYGVERLAAQGGEALLRRRCFDWYTGRLRTARAELAGAGQAGWLAWFGCERANIRALLGHVMATAETATIRDAMEALGRLWMLHGMAGECRHWIDRLLEVRDTTGEGWSGFLGVAALTMTLQDDLAAAGALLDRALVQARAEGDADTAGMVVACQGVAALFAGDVDLALQLLGAADEVGAGVAGDDVLFLLVEVFRGVAYLFKGDYPAAVAHAGQGARTGEEHGELWVRSYGMLVCGLALWLAGDLAASIERLRRSLRIKRDLGDELGMTLGLEAVAGCLCSGGEYVRAVRLLGAADRMRESTQTAWFGPHHAMLREIHTGRAAEALGERRYRAAFEEGGRLAPAQAIRDALGEAPAPDGAEDAAGACPLTDRELQVAALVAEGLSNRDIAERLTIAKRTADSHVEHILAKLGFSSRAQIAVWITEQSP